MAGNSDEQAPGTERARLDATGEFFSVGAPLHAVRAGYIQRAADRVLYQTVVAGRYAHVIAPYRSGKSSLIAATAARLENHGFKVAVLDLQQIGARDAEADAGRWYYSVAYRLLRQLRIRVDLQSWWQDNPILSNRQRLVEFYSDIILRNVQERVVVFVDEVQCIADLPFADQLLASIRAAHNSRATDPEFSRLTFVLLGECDPLSLVDEPELSPFSVTQAITLGDFSRADLDLFATELNLAPQHAAEALDRIYHWTSGQPYLSQKLARAVSREQLDGDISDSVDRLAAQQLSGRAALHNEPLMSHIHREVVNDTKRREALLNLYGRIRKGLDVPADLGSPLQRRLMAIGLLAIDEEGRLAVRNRLFHAVFTARWANEHLPMRWRAPAIAAAVVLLIVAIPFWYTQLLPKSYVGTLTSTTVDLDLAREAWQDMRSFPWHRDDADNLFRRFLQDRARLAGNDTAIAEIAALAETLPDAGRLPAELTAGYWDRQVLAAKRNERRDDALLAAIESFVLSTPQRRNRARALLASDYPMLLASLRTSEAGTVVLDPSSMLLTEIRAATVRQWSLEPDGLQRRDAWSMTALEVAPLVRRVMVDRPGVVARVGLTLNLSHARVRDLRIKVIAPSGRAVEVTPGVERASMNQDLRIPASQLRALVGEPVNGTWSLSVRDEELGVAGRLVGWNLNLNSQGVIEDFQRGLNISDPQERETDNAWFSSDGRYAVARATQSDSVRIWDLAFATPVRAIAVSELEQLVGLSSNARLLVTSTNDTINLWETSGGNRVATLPVGTAGASARLTGDGTHLLLQRRGDIETTFELWSLETASLAAQLSVAGTPAVVALDPAGTRIAVADYDRAVRVWDLGNGAQLAQIDLEGQPSDLRLAAGGGVLGAVFGEAGVSLWRIDRPQQPLLQHRGTGRWQLGFSRSGSRVLVGHSGAGFRVHDTVDGRTLGPVLGAGGYAESANLLAFSADEQIVVTGGPESVARFWDASALPVTNTVATENVSHAIWPPSGDAVAVSTPDAATIVIGDTDGDVHILPSRDVIDALLAEREGVSFFGHGSAVRHLVASPDGSSVASLAADATLRIWNIADRQPRAFIGKLPDGDAGRMAFSPDASLLGVIGGGTAQIIDTQSGELLAHFDIGEPQSGIAFSGNDHLYIGDASGDLRVIARESGDDWVLRKVWKANSGIRHLQASPRAEFLVLVDSDNIARQFSLAEGRIGDNVLQLPATVEEVSYVPGGTRVLFRTSGWVHRAISSENGLTWLDATLAPPALKSARMVFGDADNDGSTTWGNRVYLPVAGDEFASIAELRFGSDKGPGLFGKKDALLAEWRGRLGLAVVASQSPDE